MKRRKFFQLASLSVAGLTVAPSCRDNKNKNNPANTIESTNQPLGQAPNYRSTIKPAFTGGKIKGNNDTLVVGLIGAGGQGTRLILEVANLNENVRVKYICDVDDTRGGRAISELEKIQNFKPIRVRDMRKVFDDKEVDAVLIATPEHWHGLATIWACQAGKDVYVEKCISHSIIESQKMIEATMKYERIVQCGTQNRSADYANTARDYIKSGELGRVVAVNVFCLLNGPIPFNEKEDSNPPDTIDWDMWLGPAPKVPYSISRNKSWGYYWDYSGGYALANDAIHQMDLARLILEDPGFPRSVYCAGGRYLFDDNRDIPDYQMATFDYGSFIMTLQSGEFTPYLTKVSDKIRFGQDFPEWKQNGTRIEILGTKKMMYVGRMGGGWQVYDKGDDKGGKIVAQDMGIFPLNAHLKNFVNCIRSRNQPNGNIVQGHNSTVLAHLANLSYRSGNQQLIFSPEFETILNDSKARELGLPNYRKGFELPAEV